MLRLVEIWSFHFGSFERREPAGLKGPLGSLFQLEEAKGVPYGFSRPVSAVEPLGRGDADLLMKLEAMEAWPREGDSERSLYTPLEPFADPALAMLNAASCLPAAADKPDGDVLYPGMNDSPI